MFTMEQALLSLMIFLVSYTVASEFIMKMRLRRMERELGTLTERLSKTNELTRSVGRQMSGLPSAIVLQCKKENVPVLTSVRFVEEALGNRKLREEYEARQTKETKRASPEPPTRPSITEMLNSKEYDKELSGAPDEFRLPEEYQT